MPLLQVDRRSRFPRELRLRSAVFIPRLPRNWTRSRLVASDGDLHPDV